MYFWSSITETFIDKQQDFNKLNPLKPAKRHENCCDVFRVLVLSCFEQQFPGGAEAVSEDLNNLPPLLKTVSNDNSIMAAGFNYLTSHYASAIIFGLH